MTNLALCTTIYPGGIRFFDDYCRGILSVAENHLPPLNIVLVCDNLGENDFSQQAQDLRQVATLHLVSLTDGGPTAARRLMLRSAASMPITAVICYDMDDIPDPLGVTRHLNTLQTAEISYGDMDLIDEKSRPLGRTFFSGQNIPNMVDDPNILLRRNFLGFTNTAIRRDIIEATALEIPDNITAVDWWFHTHLLAKGHHAVKTNGTVVAYRTHNQSTLGALNAKNDEYFLNQCYIMRQHYRVLPSSDAVRQADRAVERLIKLPVEKRLTLLKSISATGVWYEYISKLCDKLDAQI